MPGTNLNNETIRSELSALNERWDTAFNLKQPEVLATYYDQDATVMPAGAAQVSGNKAIQEFWGTTISSGVVGHKIEMIEAGTEGNLAFQRALWSASANDADGKTQNFNGNLHLLYRRQQDGSWKVLTQIWN